MAFSVVLIAFRIVLVFLVEKVSSVAVIEI